MNAREAYKILVGRDYNPKDGLEREIHRSAVSDGISLCKDGNASQLPANELRKINDANEYRKTVQPDNVDGYLLYPSVYDVMMHLELDCSLWWFYPKTVYRGQRNHRWPLTPSLVREGVNIPTEIEKTACWVENQLKTDMSLRTYQPLDLIAIAQHYDKNTCLLDYTYNVRIAAAFACIGWKSNSENEYGVIYDFNKSDVESFIYEDE